MANQHTYHRQCGCASCSRQEQDDARAEVLALDLHGNGAVFGEALGEVTPEQHTLLAGHIASGNSEALAEILRRVQADYIASEIERRVADDRMTRLEAVRRMREVYEVAPKPAPAMPWRVAA